MAEKIIEIPEGIEARQDKFTITIKGQKGELAREFKHPMVKSEVKDKQIKFTSENERKKNVAVVGTFAAHIQNMITGVTKGWQCKLKAVYSHFPMKISVEGNSVLVQNFMGERNPRKSNIVGDSKVDIKKDEIIVTGIDKEDVGQTAANIEQVTKVTKYDRRIFQDGIYITLKNAPIEVEEKGKN